MWARSDSTFLLKKGSENASGKKSFCWEMRLEERSFLRKKSAGNLFLLILILLRGSLKRWI
jgi:hypothetical protein